MAYKASLARRSFEQQSKIYQSTLKIAAAKSIDPSIREYVVAAAVFLGHATLENYIKEIFDAIAKAFCSTGVISSKLPQELRIFTLSKSANWELNYLNFNFSGDEGRLLANLAQVFKNKKLPLINDADHAPKITGSEILSGKGYPSIENLEKVFARIGINNLFDRINKILKTNGKFLLKSFSDKRTELAHNAVMPGTNVQDIINELKKINFLITAIDRICYAHVSKHVTQRAWFLEAC